MIPVDRVRCAIASPKPLCGSIPAAMVQWVVDCVGAPRRRAAHNRGDRCRAAHVCVACAREHRRVGIAHQRHDRHAERRTAQPDQPLQSAQLLDRTPWPSGGAYHVAAPLFHATGLACCSLGLALGNRIVLARRFDAEAALAAIERHRVAALILVPTMLQRILDLDPKVLRRYDASSLRVLFAAGSSLSPDLCHRTEAAFGEVLYNLYGSTEVAVAAVATPRELRCTPGTVGRPPVGCTLAAYDDQRRRITEPGRTGTLFVSSGLSFSGYTDGGYKECVDGLLSSGDTGHFDADGLWFVDGRDDDMIVSGGENVFPLEVENLLTDHPDVIEASVIGVDDPDFGRRLRAFVVTRKPSQLCDEDIKAHVRSHLARHKIPRDVVFVDTLPRNETGKVLKAVLEGWSA